MPNSGSSRSERVLRDFAVRFGMVGGMPFGALAHAWGGWLWVGVGMAVCFVLAVVILAIEAYHDERERLAAL